MKIERSTHIDETRMVSPPVNDTPFDVAHLARLAASVELVETAARRAAAVLRVLCERNRAFHTVRLHLPGRLVRERAGVPKRDIALVRRRGRMQFVEQRGHALALDLRVVQDGRAAANVFVLLFDLRCAPFCNQGCQDRLERERDEVAVREEVLEEVVCLGYLCAFARTSCKVRESQKHSPWMVRPCSASQLLHTLM